jgi:hypothetical protein
MEYPVNISARELDNITVQNLKLHRESLCELIQDYQQNDKILDAYQRSLLMGYQEALYGIEAVLKHLDYCMVRY